MGISGMEAGRPLPLYPGDLREVLEVRAELTDTKDSCSSLSLWTEVFELRLNRPIAQGWSREAKWRNGDRWKRG